MIIIKSNQRIENKFKIRKEFYDSSVTEKAGPAYAVDVNLGFTLILRVKNSKNCALHFKQKTLRSRTN